MTFTIVGYDEHSVGIATASRWVAVGNLVPWVNTGGAAVATQAFTDKSYGPRGLEAMEAGEGADSALHRLIQQDPGADYRQLIFLDKQGVFSCHTGRGALLHSTHYVGDQAAAAGNMLASPEIPELMVEAFNQAEGNLPERLLHALSEGEAAGGDVRGKQAAAIRVEPAVVQPVPEEQDFGVDLRVDDHADPIPELQRIYQVFLDSTRVAEVAFPGSYIAGRSKDLVREFVIQHDTVYSAGDPQLWRSLICVMAGDEEAARRALGDDQQRWPTVQAWAQQLDQTGLRWV